VIRATHVTKVFPGQGRPAIDDVTIEVERGEFVMILGDSGAGKTTLLKLLHREILPTNGMILVDGSEITTMSQRRVATYRRMIGYVPQEIQLLPNRTAYENIAFTFESIGKSRGVARRVVPELLELAGLGGKEHRYPHEYSSVERQRLSTIRAFANRPKLLLLDEPTAYMDESATVDFLRLFDRINRTGTTVLLSTEDFELQRQMRRRAIVFDAGRIVRDFS
jgi:cell division transport system ATP-binding protein